MRRLIPASALLLAGCATAPPVPVVPAKPAVVETSEQGALIGLGANELVARLGTPRLQIREGDGTKLQFSAPACILDAYLYPPPAGQGIGRVTHVDTRTRDGRATDQLRCLTAIETR
ncbi:MAG: hypothetical protein H0W65_03005 [Sphingomonas sp.]|uniref:hypothetical protein n=1 Tax=Sphingomonas sp. TaxID=28214 RepID=UPI0017FF4FCE|nr:hypothetical protein [Sphingomonas sp.]MBA3666677.1 hypothetical protein [Sphingomonas sp.]